MNNDFLISHRYFENPKSFLFKPDAHELWEFLFVIKGNIVCMIEGENYLIGENTLIVSRPTQVHGIQISENHPFEYVSLMCGDWTLPNEFLKRLYDSTTILPLEDTEPIYQTLMEFNRWSNDGEAAVYQRIRKRLVTELMQLVFCTGNKTVTVEPFSRDPVVSSAVAYIELNIHNIRGLSDICDAIGVNKACLYNRFTKNMMISPTKYIRLKRIAMARRMLCDETDSMKAFD